MLTLTIYINQGTGKHWFLRRPPLSEPALQEVDKVVIISIILSLVDKVDEVVIICIILSSSTL